MASFAIESAAKWVGKLLVDEVEFLAKVTDKVKRLEDELKWMKAYLWDADHKQYKNTVIREWISDIRDLAQEAEDVIELYILEVSYKREKPLGLIPWTDLKWLLCCMRDAKTLHSVGSDIDTFISKINELTGRSQRYGITRSNYELIDPYLVFEKRFIDQRRTYSHTEDVVIGLDEHVKVVADQLVNGPQKVAVIHGMGGIGKTTLARKVYNHASLKGQFEGFAWAYVSQQLQLGSVCKKILLELIPKKDKEKRKSVKELEDSQLPTELYHVLKNTKCLVVLDDIWSAKDWDCLTHAFPLNDNSRNSRVLVTTRHYEIFLDYSSHVVYSYEAKFLNPNQSWELLEKKADFSRDNAEPRMLEVGEEMLKHCNGHPLAIVVLGRILARKRTVKEWQDVRDNLQFNLQRDGLCRGVYEVLALSYYELSYHLKACFLVLGYFPEGFEIPAERLYHLWIAEGIVSPRQDREVGKRSLEDIAKVYLNELVHKGLVQVVSRDVMGDIKVCKLHDLMRDKCLQIAEDENFLLTSVCAMNHMLQQQNPSSCILDDKIRRLAVYVDDSVLELESLANSTKLSRLKSLLLFPSGETSHYGSIGDIPQSIELLRILDFTGFSSVRLSSSIGTLIYLRYLSLRGTRITELPSEIGNLRSLLILDLRLEGLRLPDVLWKIKSLKQLYLPSSGFWPDEKMGYVIEDSKALRLDKLSHLEIIDGLDLDTAEVKGLQELSTSLSLERLEAKCSNKKENLDPCLKSSTIKSLSLRIEGSILHDHPKMLSDCHHLHHLSIGVGDISDIIAFPPNLVKVKLWRCELSKETISTLGKLPQLKKLTLVLCGTSVELHVHISSNSFPKLTHLVMKESPVCMRWTIERGGLPELTHLVIKENPGIINWTVERGGLPELTHLVIKENPGVINWTVERGGLPELTHLEIKENLGITEWTVEGRFPKLTHLVIKENRGCIEWTVEGGGLPELTHFVIEENLGIINWTVQRGGLPELTHLVFKENHGDMNWTVEGGGLPDLTHLEFEENLGITDWTVEGRFPKLTHLVIKENHGRIEWTVEGGGLAELTHFVIEENLGIINWTVQRGGLRELTHLVFEENHGVIKWTVEGGGLPELTHLEIKENRGRIECTVEGRLPKLTPLVIKENPGLIKWTVERGKPS